MEVIYQSTVKIIFQLGFEQNKILLLGEDWCIGGSDNPCELTGLHNTFKCLPVVIWQATTECMSPCPSQTWNHWSLEDMAGIVKL